MPTFRVYERQSDNSLLQLNVLGEYNGQDANGDPILTPVNISNVDEAALPLTPLTPLALAGTMSSRTVASLSWTAPNNSGRPPITEYRIFRSDDGAAEDYIDTVSPTTLTFSDNPVPVNTPEIVFRYTVRAVNVDGVGDASNVVTLQYSGVPAQGPTAPTGLGYSQLTSTSVRLAWSETFDSTITKHGLFKGNTLVIDNLDANAIGYLWTGLTSGVQQVNVNIRRYNTAFGWSPASNSVTFTPITGTVAHDIVMGCSPESVSHNTYSQWDAVRGYRLSSAKSQVASFGCRILALTDDPNCPMDGQASSATILENFLEDFYYGSGASARQNVELHWANSNENSRDFLSGTLPAAVLNTYALMYAVVHKQTSGVRRYPKASMWVNMTNYTIIHNGTGPRMRAIAPYLDGFSCSMYPRGSLTKGGGSQHPLWSAYAQDIDPVIATLVDWRTLNPALNQFASWEIGMPIDNWQTATGSTHGTPTAQTNLSIRPRYFCGGKDSAGTNWAGYMNYLYTACDTNGIIMREQLWWDNITGATATDTPYPFYHDKGLTTPDTEHAWRNWTPGSTLANA
jgi:hypothetical protein